MVMEILLVILLILFRRYNLLDNFGNLMNIIYHTPFELSSSSATGSGIRPIKMLNAFKKVGADVTIVAGTAKERARIIERINHNLINGMKYDFCYSESPSLPTLLTEKHRFPLHPFLDFNFFKNLKLYNVPIGLFYRDIYWKFNDYSNDWSYLKNKIANFFYRYDLKKYSQLIDIIYLPSIEMGQYIPYISRDKFRELPPGCDISYDEDPLLDRSNTSKLNLFYVGGISSHYQMHELFKGISLSDCKLQVCNRINEWDRVKNEYLPYCHNIEVVHKSGKDLKELYLNADIACLFVKPDQYRTFAVPIKLYEYLGEGKPIIASKGTLVGKFVEENNIGWAIEYTSGALVDLLKNLQSEPEKVKSAQLRVKALAEKNTWDARVKTVINDF